MSGEVPLQTSTDSIFVRIGKWWEVTTKGKAGGDISERHSDENGLPSREWKNPWDNIYATKGVPEDLKQPYFNFEFIMGEIERLEQPAGRSQRKRVLDVAMGPGRHAIALCEAGFDVCGFDISQRALDLAVKEIKERGLECNMSIGDMFGKYQYQDSFFDAVVAIQAIYHGYPPHMKAALNEIKRVLRPGGLLAFTVSMDCERPMTDTDGRKFVGKALEERDYYEVDGYEDTYVFHHGREAGLPHFYPGEDILEMMLWQSGFNNLQSYKDHERKYRLVWCNAQN